MSRTSEAARCTGACYLGGMQIQPFQRRSSDATIEVLQSMQDLHNNMRTLYARPPSVSYVDTQAELPLGPKPGDLHPWDALVDGCLYYDDECRDSRQYLMQYDGAWIWLCKNPDEAVFDWKYLLNGNANRFCPTSIGVSPTARVVATSIDTAEKCRDAIAAHRSSLIGGAK